MSKRDPLKRLIKKYPPPEDLEGIMGRLSSESDRSAAIIAAGILEGLLERIIIYRLANKDPNLIGKLFNNRGPLSDFHSKILIASALGIISQLCENDMHRVKAIRNVFAHAVNQVTFDTPEIATEIDEINIINVMYRAKPDGRDGMKKLNNKSAYILAVNLMCIAYDGFHQKAGGSPIITYYSDSQPRERGTFHQKS